MGRPKPMNGTVGATKKKLEQIKTALENGDYETVDNFLIEAIKACDGDYIVIAAEDETIEE